MIVRYRGRALADIDELYAYLTERSPQGARNVLREIYRSVAVVAEQPLACEQTDDPEIRVKIVRRYRYKIFYHVPNDDGRNPSRAPYGPQTLVRRGFGVTVTSPSVAA